MRITAQVPAELIATSYRAEASDRHVELNVFVPHATYAPPTIHARRNFWLLEGIKTWIFSSTDPSRINKLAIGAGGGGVPPYAHAIPRRPLLSAMAPAWQSELTAIQRAGSLSDLSAALGGLASRMSDPLSQQAPRRSFFSGGTPQLTPRPPQVGFLRSLLDGLRLRLQNLPLGTPTASSAIGFLFLDRTRIRSIGCDIGERFDSIPLIPGQEALFEVKTSVRRTSTIEDSIEREYERALEQSAQDVRTDVQTTSGQTNTNTGMTTGSTADVGLPDASSIPVDASLGLSVNNTYNEAQTDSAQHSLTVATTTANRVTSKMRENHKSTVKREVDESFESLTRNTMRNINQARPIVVHYYKVMQRLELQHQRTGTRLCWAPFLLDPGAGTRFRAAQQADRVAAAALASASIPTKPQPPKKQFGPTWVKGEAMEASGGGPFALQIYASMTARLEITLADASTFTGRVRVAVSGPDKDIVHAKVVGEPLGPDDEGIVSADVQIEIGMKLGTCEFSLRLLAEVLAELPGYKDEYEAYQKILDDYNSEVARIQTRALDEARPAVEAAARDVIAATDVRDELLAAVFQQFVTPFGVSPDRIELWHRMVDFENLGYVVYPGWWRYGGLPLPEYGTKHFVNASVARVFLPIRPGYEAQALHELFDAGSLSSAEVDEFNKMVGELTAAVATPDAVTSVGDPWCEWSPTDGTHVEVEFSAAAGLDETTTRQLEATVARLEAEVAALRSDNQLRASVQAPDRTSLRIGPVT